MCSRENRAERNTLSRACESKIYKSQICDQNRKEKNFAVLPFLSEAETEERRSKKEKHKTKRNNNLVHDMNFYETMAMRLVSGFCLLRRPTIILLALGVITYLGTKTTKCRQKETKNLEILDDEQNTNSLN